MDVAGITRQAVAEAVEPVERRVTAIENTLSARKARSENAEADLLAGVETLRRDEPHLRAEVSELASRLVALRAFVGV